MTTSIRRIQRPAATVALALALAVLAVPSALATSCPCNAGLPLSTDSTPATNASPPIVHVVEMGGFDWGDFGIGIAAALGSLLVLAGLAIGVRQTRRSHHPLGSV
jgi:hypothetical protein